VRSAKGVEWQATRRFVAIAASDAQAAGLPARHTIHYYRPSVEIRQFFGHAAAHARRFRSWLENSLVSHARPTHNYGTRPIRVCQP